jgi:hypothetical protein
VCRELTRGLLAYLPVPMARKSVPASFPLQHALRKPFWFALLVVCAALGIGSQGKAASVTPTPSVSGKLTSRFAIADFDGDSRPDLATVEIGQTGASRARYWIGFRMAAGVQQLIGITAPVGGLEIASRDVNGDKNLDLIVSTAWLNRPIVVLVNDGHGNFTATDPSVFSAIVWSRERIWTLPNLEIKDGAIALFPSESGGCALSDGVTEPSRAPQPLADLTSRRSTLSFTASTFGRAPPAATRNI